MKKKLVRNKEDVLVSGVLSGMANYFNQDPLLFRVLAIGFLILTGIFPGLLLYIVAWFMIPKEGDVKADYEIK